MGTEGGQLLMIGLWPEKTDDTMAPWEGGWDGWEWILSRYNPRMLFHRERGKWPSGCVRVIFCQNWSPFYPRRPQLFSESVHPAGKYIFTSACWKLRCEEHFIVWLRWFVLSACAQKRMEHGRMSHRHITRVEHSVQQQLRTSGLNWIDNTSAGDRSGKLANSSLYPCLGESRFLLEHV